MAFRRFRKRSPGFRRKRSNPYEIAQIQVCRKGLELGISSCQVPDQFFTPLISGSTWVSPFVTLGNIALVTAREGHAAKDIVVRGVQFDYQYSCVVDVTNNAEAAFAVGALSIRSGLVVMQHAVQIDESQPILPLNPDAAILFRSQTLRVESEAGALQGFNAETEANKKYRTLWRGMDMIVTPNLMLVGAGPVQDTLNVLDGSFPIRNTQSRHVRCRTGVRLSSRDSLFLVTEVVNPFLEEFPTLGLDLLGSLVVKDVRRSQVYDR